MYIETLFMNFCKYNVEQYMGYPIKGAMQKREVFICLHMYKDLMYFKNIGITRKRIIQDFFCYMNHYEFLPALNILYLKLKSNNYKI